MGMGSSVACLGQSPLRDGEGGWEERFVLLIQFQSENSNNTHFCCIAGGGNASFESLLHVRTCEVIGVGGVRAISSLHIAAC